MLPLIYSPPATAFGQAACPSPLIYADSWAHARGCKSGSFVVASEQRQATLSRSLIINGNSVLTRHPQSCCEPRICSWGIPIRPASGSSAGWSWAA